MPGIAHTISHCGTTTSIIAFLLDFVNRPLVNRFVNLWVAERSDSAFGKRPHGKSLPIPTFGAATKEDSRRTRASWDAHDLFSSAVVLAAVLGAYLYFRG